MKVSDYSAELNAKGIISFSPNGESMWPFIKNGKTTVIVEKCNQFDKFDVVLYKHNGLYKLHRIILIKADGFTIMGDGLLVEENISKEEVIGKMKEFYYKGKTISANDPKYLERVKSYYSNENKRSKKIKIHQFFLKIKYKLTH